LAIDECFDVFELINDEEKINGIMLSIIDDEIGNDFIDKGNQFIIGFVVLESDFIFVSNVACKVAHVFMAPTCKVIIGSLEEVV
jgi:hypothetical protein